MTIERLAAYIIVGSFALGVCLLVVLGLFAVFPLEFFPFALIAACFLFLGYYYLTYWRHTGFDYSDTWR